MSVLKQAQRSATLSFSAGPAGTGYLAAGSVAGAVDLDFSNVSVLEVGRRAL